MLSYPNIPGFRIALRLSGMTKNSIVTQSLIRDIQTPNPAVMPQLRGGVVIEKSLIFLHVILNLIQDPGFYLSVIILDSGSEPGMTN